MPTLYITRGLPSSGKSTRAKEWVAADPRTRAQVNRDELRRMMHDGVHLLPLEGADGTEKAVTEARDALITAQLRLGKDVVCSDTNLPSRTVRHLIGLALEAGAAFEVWDLSDIPLDVCLVRNELRDESSRVPKETITDMHRRFVAGKGYPLPMPEQELVPALVPYEPREDTPMAFIVDIDGTLALHNGRDPYDESRVRFDLPNADVVRHVQMLHRGVAEVVFMSGRTENCREDTRDWLLGNVGFASPLYMRAAGDTRKDWIVKYELFDKHVRNRYHVVGVFDDRNQVVKMWRALGLTVFQVADGDF